MLISPVILHLLLAAEPFAAPVALVVAGDVAPLMDHQVVSLAEASVTPTTVEGFSNRLDLKEKFVLAFVKSIPYFITERLVFTYLEWLFPVYNFGLVHVYAEADSKHLEYLDSGFTLCCPVRCGHLISALDLTLKMVKTFKHRMQPIYPLSLTRKHFPDLYKAVFKADKNLNNYHKTICHRDSLEWRHVKLSPEKVYSHHVGTTQWSGDLWRLSSPHPELRRGETIHFILIRHKLSRGTHSGI